MLLISIRVYKSARTPINSWSVNAVVLMNEFLSMQILIKDGVEN